MVHRLAVELSVKEVIAKDDFYVVPGFTEWDVLNEFSAVSVVPFTQPRLYSILACVVAGKDFVFLTIKSRQEIGKILCSQADIQIRVI